jgi:cell filamentation protein
VSQDPYLDPRAGVLRNRLGLTDPGELDRAEADLTGYRLVELHERALPGAYDLAHLQAFRFIFGDLYDWAGELRTVSIARTDLFCLPQNLIGFAEDVFGKLARRDHYLRDLDRAPFVAKLADLLGDINALHPFREGNGRTQRAFLAQLARAAGHPIRWGAMDPEVNIVASQAAHRGDNEPLAAMLDQLVDPASPPPPDQPQHPARTASSTYAPPAAGPRANRPEPGSEVPRPRGGDRPSRGQGPSR